MTYTLYITYLPIMGAIICYNVIFINNNVFLDTNYSIMMTCKNSVQSIIRYFYIFWNLFIFNQNSTTYFIGVFDAFLILLYIITVTQLFAPNLGLIFSLLDTVYFEWHLVQIWHVRLIFKALIKKQEIVKTVITPVLV